MSSFENFVVSNLGVRKPLIFDVVPPSSSTKAAGIKGSQFLDITTNQLYEKTGYNDETDWVYLRPLGQGGSSSDDTFIQFSGETLANFIALNDDVFDINSEIDTLSSSVRSVVGGGVSTGGGGTNLSLYTLSTDFDALSGQFLGSLTQFTNDIDAQINTLSSRIGSYPGLSMSDDPPLAPEEGDLWWETDSGRLKIYYNDGTNSFWVDASPISNYGSSSGGGTGGGTGGSVSFSLNQLTDVSLTSATNGDIIQYNGSYWENFPSPSPGNFVAYNFSKPLRTDNAEEVLLEGEFIQDYSGSAPRRLEVQITVSPGYSRTYIEIHTNCYNSTTSTNPPVFKLERKVGASSSVWTDIDYFVFPATTSGDFTFRTFVDTHSQNAGSILVYRLSNVTNTVNGTTNEQVTQVFSSGGHTFTIRECN